MNLFTNKSAIYSRKAFWKRVLVVTALILVGISFFYSSRLVKKLSLEERLKVQVWAKAIESRARTVSTTASLFEDLARGEREKIELWAQATEALVEGNIVGAVNNSYINLALDIIKTNTTIPIIITDDKYVISSWRNVAGVIETIGLDSIKRDSAEAANRIILDSTLNIMIERGSKIEGNAQFLFYKDSRVLEELRLSFENIQTSFVKDIVSMAASTPVIVMRNNEVVASNLLSESVLNDSVQLQKMLTIMAADNEPIKASLTDDLENVIYYSDSELMQALKYYSIVQIIVIVLFVLIGYWLFSIFRRSEQNKVWVGMAKETAHQLGTPLSSLMGWMDYLRMKKVDESILVEMQKDVERLNMITDRFSKIGAKPKLDATSLGQSVQKFVTYFETRTPRNVKIKFDNEYPVQLTTPINEPLFHWVIENLCKNGIDAMKGNGLLRLKVWVEAETAFVEVTDTGGGIPFNKRSAVFQPGYTSKERGWGLGLSLSKRIMKEYHNGRIFVAWSEVGKGTTFRLELKQ